MNTERDLKSGPFRLPYEDLVEKLLVSILSALGDICEATDKDKGISDSLVNRHFAWLQEDLPWGMNAHLFTSPLTDKSLRIRKKHQNDHPKHATRISRLVISAFEQSEEYGRRSSKFYKGGLNRPLVRFLPSPLAILAAYLTVPFQPASADYAFVTLRIMLFRLLKVWPAASSNPPSGYQFFYFEDIQNELNTFQTYQAGRDSVPPRNSPFGHLLGHYLAMHGMVYLRFGGETALNDSVHYCREGSLLPKPGSPFYEYRIHDAVDRLPQSSELLNRLCGLPIPIDGADVVFFGGLLFSRCGGLVVSLSGLPGTGKTSFCLGFASSLAPLGARVLYIVSEESKEDLCARMQTLTPTYLRNLSFDSQVRERIWFTPIAIPAYMAEKNEKGSLLSEIIAEINKHRPAPAENSLPLPVPLIVILDGLRWLLPAARKWTKLAGLKMEVERKRCGY